MKRNDEILALLATWAESGDSGKAAVLDELRRERPELLADLRSHIAALHAMSWLNEVDPADDADSLSVPLGTRAGHAAVSREVGPQLSLEEFRRQLLASGLLTAETLEAVEKRHWPDGIQHSGRELADQLIAERRLTPYQVRAITTGRGQQLVHGNYVILDQLGQGGMGQVFKARHQRMDRLVALKILPERSVETPGAVERFHREVKAAARLIHPNIVTAYDADCARGTHFLVMELVEGVDLMALVSHQGPLAIPDVLNCSLQAARGLAYAHDQGIIHRDIKPANILIDRKGQIRILDMGLARLMDVAAEIPAAGSLTQDGTVLGTVDYMAPEQAASTQTADARSDIYSLGCTLFFLLTGRSPYSGESLLGRMLAHREDPIPDLAAIRPDTPQCLVQICNRALAKNPMDRFEHMAAFIDALEQCRRVNSSLTGREGGELPLGRNMELPSEPTLATRDTSSLLGVETMEHAIGQTMSPPGAETQEVAAPMDESSAKPTSVSGPQPLNETDKPHAVPSPTYHRHIGKAIALALASSLLLAVVLYCIQTNRGTIVVYVDDDNVDAKLQKEGLVLQDATTKRTWKLQVESPEKLVPGEYRLVRPAGLKLLVADDTGAEFKTDEFTIKRGSKVSVRVTLETPSVAKDRASATAGSTSAAPTDRLAAQWALQMGGKVEVFVDDKFLELSSPRNLPAEGAIRVQAIELPEECEVSEKQLSALASLRSLTTLGCYGVRLTDAAAPRLARITSLKQLGLGKTQITDAALAHIATLPQLTHLRLGETRITDAGLMHLQGCQTLQTLDLQQTAVTPSGLAAFKIALPGCQINGPGNGP